MIAAFRESFRIVTRVSDEYHREDNVLWSEEARPIGRPAQSRLADTSPIDAVMTSRFPKTYLAAFTTGRT